MADSFRKQPRCPFDKMVAAFNTPDAMPGASVDVRTRLHGSTSSPRLAPLDALAGRFFSRLSETHSICPQAGASKPNLVYGFNGHDLERPFANRYESATTSASMSC